MLNHTRYQAHGGGKRGSVLLEHAVVLGGVGTVLAVFAARAIYGVSDGFGPLGQQVVAFYQRALGGLSLPVP